MPKIYDQFATVYDRMGADRHSLRMCDYTLDIFKKFRIKPKTGLEICCGTGSALKFFADREIDMCGVDQSPRMLAEARRKVGNRAALRRTVLPNLKITDRTTKRHRQFDFAYSYFDSLNYLLSGRELSGAFRNIGSHVVKGGWFIFDMNTPYALRTVWGNNTATGVLDSLAWIFRNSYDSANVLATARTTFFLKNGTHWKRFDETHNERAYPNAVLGRFLTDAGFTVKGMYKCYTFERASERTARVCVVARKRT